MMRRKFSQEFKIEAVSLMTDQCMAVRHAARDLDVAESMLRHWMRELDRSSCRSFSRKRADGSRFGRDGHLWRHRFFVLNVVSGRFSASVARRFNGFRPLFGWPAALWLWSDPYAQAFACHQIHRFMV